MPCVLASIYQPYKSASLHDRTICILKTLHTWIHFPGNAAQALVGEPYRSVRPRKRPEKADPPSFRGCCSVPSPEENEWCTHTVDKFSSRIMLAPGVLWQYLQNISPLTLPVSLVVCFQCHSCPSSCRIDSWRSRQFRVLSTNGRRFPAKLPSDGKMSFALTSFNSTCWHSKRIQSG